MIVKNILLKMKNISETVRFIPEIMERWRQMMVTAVRIKIGALHKSCAMRRCFLCSKGFTAKGGRS